MCLQLIADGNPVLREIRTDRGVGGAGVNGALARSLLEFSFKVDYAYNHGMPQWLARMDHLLSPLRLERLFLGRHKYAHFRVWYRDSLAKYVQEILLDQRTLQRWFLNRNTVQRIVAQHVMVWVTIPPRSQTSYSGVASPESPRSQLSDDVTAVRMALGTFRNKAMNLYTRTAYRSLFRKPVQMRNHLPLVSFSFDDFPRSAYEAGGAILKSHGFRGTYYAALGLMGTQAPVGEIFSEEDLPNVLADGHELGCHTFGHCDAWNTAPGAFERSILENHDRLKTLLPEASFKTLSYPKSGPRPHTKRRAARHFPCCRFGGQTYNAGVTDRYLLSATFSNRASMTLTQ